jgi:hypothetical protein
MSRQTDPDQILSREQLDHYRKQLARLSPFSLERVYEDMREKCRFDGKVAPQASAIQSLVAIWKELRQYYPRK